jgi:hypothetical protein
MTIARVELCSKHSKILQQILSIGPCKLKASSVRANRSPRIMKITILDTKLRFMDIKERGKK